MAVTYGDFEKYHQPNNKNTKTANRNNRNNNVKCIFADGKLCSWSTPIQKRNPLGVELECANTPPGM